MTFCNATRDGADIWLRARPTSDIHGRPRDRTTAQGSGDSHLIDKFAERDAAGGVHRKFYGQISDEFNKTRLRPRYQHSGNGGRRHINILDIGGAAKERFELGERCKDKCRVGCQVI